MLIAWLGENFSFTGLGLFIPQWFWLVLLGIVAVAALLAKQSNFAMCVGASMLLMLLGPMHWRPARVEPQAETGVRVVSWNRDDGDDGSFFAFIQKHQPDVIFIQGANGWAPLYAHNLPGYHLASADEFLLLSRFPIAEAREVYLQALTRRVPLAARFVVELPSGPVALYNVHLLTPRDAIEASFSTNGGSETFDHAFWRNRLAMARELANRAALDPLPSMLAGDFNAPAWGRIYRAFSQRFQDAHRIAGTGFGFTFPDKKNYRIQPPGRWMRLDCLFADDRWTILHSNVQRVPGAEHLPICITLQPTP